MSLLVVIPIGAQEISGYEKLLVPVLNQKVITGANNSRFSTTFGVFARGRQIRYYPAGQADFFIHLPEEPVVAGGRFVYVEPAGVSLPFFAMAQSFTADGASVAAPLPVVREKDTTTQLSTFAPIDIAPVFGPKAPGSGPHGRGPFLGFAVRYTLRVYDWDSTGRLQVDVRLYRTGFSNSFATPLEEHRVAVNRRDADDPTYPYYAEIRLDSLFAANWCSHVPGLQECQPAYAVIEVAPATPGARYYALVSATDNMTNQVVVLTRLEP